MTFSISARCARSGAFGIAVSSSSICVAARCGVWARAGAGVVATQNVTDPALGALGLNRVAEGSGCVAAGNILATEAVPAKMVAAFEASSDHHLAECLLRGLEAGLEAGGEQGEVRSAGLYVVGSHVFPLVDLRVDWHDAPIAELRGLWRLYEPQMEAYLGRALDPERAPSYGVPGDL